MPSASPKTCLHCGTPLEPGKNSRGYCRPDYRRWREAGYPDSGPPPLLTPEERRAANLRNLAKGHQTQKAGAEARYQVFVQLRAAGVKRQRAARLAGVSKDSVAGYERRRLAELEQEAP